MARLLRSAAMSAGNETPREWFLHPAGKLELLLPPGWVARKHDGLQFHFGPSDRGVGELVLATLEIKKPGLAGRLLGRKPPTAEECFLQILPGLMSERTSEVESGTLGELAFASATGLWRDDATGRLEEGRAWLLARGEQGVLAMYSIPRGQAEAAIEESLAAEEAIATIDLLDPVPLDAIAPFAAKVLGRIRPGAAVEAVSRGVKLDGETFSLDMVAGWCERHPGFVRPIVSAYVRELAGVHPAGPPPRLDDVRHRIRPVLRPDVFYEECSPGFKPLRRLVVPKLFASYVVSCAYDAPYVTEAVLESWGVTEQFVDELALSGLEHAANEVPVEVTGPVVRCGEEDGWTASRLLSPTFLHRISRHLGERFVVAIPSRDELLALREPVDVAGLKQKVLELATTRPFPMTHVLVGVAIDGNGRPHLTAVG